MFVLTQDCSCIGGDIGSAWTHTGIDDSFEIAHLPFLKKIIDAHVLGAPMEADVALLNQKEALDVDSFNLLMKKWKYDVEVYEVWAQKCQSARSAHQHKTLEQFNSAR